MRSKKSLRWSTLVGAIIVAVVFIYLVLPVLGALYRTLFPAIDPVTLQSYERLVYGIKSIDNFPSEIIIPISVHKDYQIVDHETGAYVPSHCPEGCLCLCKATTLKGVQGCLLKMYRQNCLRTENIDIKTTLGFTTPANRDYSYYIVRVLKDEKAKEVSLSVQKEWEGPIRKEKCLEGKGNYFIAYTSSYPSKIAEVMCVKCSASRVDVRETLNLNPPIKNCEGYSQYFYFSGSIELHGYNIPGLLPEYVGFFKKQCEEDPCNAGVTGKCYWNSTYNACLGKGQTAYAPGYMPSFSETSQERLSYAEIAGQFEKEQQAQQTQDESLP